MKFHLRTLSRRSGKKKPLSTDDNAPQWTLIGDGSEHLRTKLEELYWIGVEGELANILFTLKSWRSEALADVRLDDESDDFLHGFDTFIDQVEEGSQRFAEEVGKERVMKGYAVEEKKDYRGTLESRVREGTLRERSRKIKAEIRVLIEQDQPEESQEQKRARLLLQAMGLLDIEKMIVDAPPLGDMPLARRPAFPQLQLDSVPQSGMPVLSPLLCSVCHNMITRSMYRRESPMQTPTEAQNQYCYVCESCYRDKFLGRPEFVKVYKHCIFDEIITPSVAKGMCKCHGAVGFPVNRTEYHRKGVYQSSTYQSSTCPLLRLGDLASATQYEGMQALTGTGTKEYKIRWRREKEQPGPNVGFLDPKSIEGNKPEDRSRSLMGLKHKTRPSVPSIANGTAQLVRSQVEPEPAEGDEDIPPFLQQFEDRNPFGNVRMAVRFGPIVVELDTSSSEMGASIALKDPLQLHIPEPGPEQTCFAVDETRQLWSPKTPSAQPNRFKAIMKVVVGSPFTGVLDQSLETSIINRLVDASTQSFDESELSEQGLRKLRHQLLDPVIDELKTLLQPNLSIYLQSLVDQLLSPETNLTWSSTTNNCQTFCDSLIDPNLFGPLTSPPTTDTDKPPPLYLLSFLTRPSPNNTAPKIRSKFDVPRGLTEEYLLRYRCGRQDESDLIDSLHEYWHDWGAFDSPLCKYHSLFPWDCTEAFGRYPVVCGECNLSKHLWAFPFDSWSIVSLHLTRDRYSYPPDVQGDGGILSNSAWMRNRLLLLSAQDKLSRVAAAMATNPRFKQGTDWLHTQANPAQDRVKLGGIHRAQPSSHTSDRRGWKGYFVAPWIHLLPEQRVEKYMSMRNARFNLPDVEFAEDLHTYSPEYVFGMVQHGKEKPGPQYDGRVKTVDAMMDNIERRMVTTRTRERTRPGGGGGSDSASYDYAYTSNDSSSTWVSNDIGCAANCAAGCGSTSSTCGSSSACGSSSSGGGGGSSSGGGGGGSSSCGGGSSSSCGGGSSSSW